MMKSQKGITLIALIITVIVILILAGTAISIAINGGDIFGKASEAREGWNIAVQKEQTEIDNVLSLLDLASSEQIPTKWSINDETQTVTAGDVTLKIGDFVDYNPFAGVTNLNSVQYEISSTDSGYEKTQTAKLADYEPSYYYFDNNDELVETTELPTDGKPSICGNSWRVLGVDDRGQLLLIATECIPLRKNGEVQEELQDILGLNMRGYNAYINLNSKLDGMCEIFGRGTGAVTARSISVEDINKLTGYNPNCVGVKNPTSAQISSGHKYKEGTIGEYDIETTFYWDGTNKPYYTTSNSLSGNLNNAHNSGFYWIQNNILNSSEKSTTATSSNKVEIATIKNTSYEYYIDTLKETAYTNDTDTPKVGITEDSNVYKAIDFDVCGYWLTAEKQGFKTNTASDTKYEGFQYSNAHRVITYGMYGTDNTGSYQGPIGVRPVVTISNNASFEATQVTMYDDSTLWHMTVE